MRLTPLAGLLFVAALFTSASASAEAAKTYPGDFQAKVAYVSDGDTITVSLPSKKTVRIRFANVDAPEKTQPYGLEAKAHLLSILKGQEVRILVHETDRYGRAVAEVFFQGVNMNRYVVQHGLAYVYGRYNVDPHIVALERVAKQNRIGIWGIPDADRVYPWDYRDRMRNK